MPKKKPGTGKKRSGVAIPERFPGGHVKPAGDGAEALAPTLIKRLKDDVLPRAKDKRLGTVLGIMHLEGILTEAETEAGMRYAADVGAYERAMGHPMRHARSPSFEGGFKGGGIDLDHVARVDPEAAQRIESRIKRRKRAIQKRYDKAQTVIPAFPHHVGTMIDEVCCNDRRINQVFHPDLKRVLANLARHYGIAIAAEKRPKPIGRHADAALLASGAVEALADWLEKRKATVSGYRLAAVNNATRRHVRPAITAYGMTEFGKAVEHTITLNRSGLMVEEINAQLIKAAEAREWPAMKPAEAVTVDPAALEAGIRKLKKGNAA